MLRSNKGITLTILVITIIIMIVLAAVTMSINIGTSKTVDVKVVVANMELIKQSAQSIADKYFDNEVSGITLPGIKNYESDSIVNKLMEEIYEEGTELIISQYWYRLDNSALKEMNIDIELNGDEAYFVDYQNMDVAYVKSKTISNGKYPGFRDRNGNYLYFYSQLKNIKSDQLGN